MAEAKSVVEKVKEAINKLPFNNLVGKIPALAKFSGYANYAACALAVILVVAVAKPSSSGGSGSSFGSTVKVTSQDIIEKVSKLKKESTIQVQGFIDCETLRWAVESSPFLIDLDLSKTQGLSKIEVSTFKKCQQLAAITLPASLKEIDSFAFLSCPNFTTLRFAGTLSQWCSINESDVKHYWNEWRDKDQPIEIYVDGKRIKGNLEIPKGTTYINSYAFANCPEITSVKFPEDIAIDGYAFYGCTGLHSVELPTGATIKREGPAFKKSGITKVTIAADAKEIPQEAFEDCSEISVTVTPGKTGVISFKAKNEAFKSAVIEKGITEIGEYTFYGCKNLDSIKIPDSVTLIGKSAFSHSGIQSVELPKNLTAIGKNAFTNSKLTSINISEGVTIIDEGAFYECKDLESVTLPTTLTAIKKSAFENCEKLVSVEIPDGVTEIGRNAFQKCTNLVSIKIPGSVEETGEAICSDCTALTSISFGDGIKNISQRAFRSCSALESVTLPKGLERVSAESFQFCSKLSSVTIPKTVKEIEGYAFSETSLSSAVFEEQSLWDYYKQETMFGIDPAVDAENLETLHFKMKKL